MYYLDWFYCTLLRSGNALARSLDLKPRIPEERFLSDSYFLPIDQTSTRDNLLHLIENNKMVFLNGPPSIGKSIRVRSFFEFPSIIRLFRSVNIFMMIISIANGLFVFFIVVRILSLPMHSHRFSHHQINRSIVSPLTTCIPIQSLILFHIVPSRSLTSKATSLITITSHEFLLHTLISGDYLLKSSITHLIIDDVHQRSHTLDMLLAYFKDAQQKFRHLKLIFIQTIIQYDALVKYFGNVATYTSNFFGMDLFD